MKCCLGEIRLARPFFAPDPKALRDAKTPGTGRPKARAGRARPGAVCPRRGGAECAFPFDARIGLVDGMTPCVSGLLQRASVVCGSFDEGVTVLAEFAELRFSKSAFRVRSLRAGRRAEAEQDTPAAGLSLVPAYSAAQIARSVECELTMYIMMDGSGVPCVKADLSGSKGKNGPAKTREIKVGIVGFYSRVDKKTGRPVRDRKCEIHIATMAEAAEFGLKLRALAIAAGYGRKGIRVQIIADGATWIMNVADNGFHANIDGTHPQDDDVFATDFYHACGHLHEFVVAVEKDAARVEPNYNKLKKVLVSKGAEEACKAIAKDYGVPVEGTEARTQYDYLWSRRRFMRYGEFRRKGMFIGSGPIESACRTDVARRCKQSGMHWRIRNASSMCALVSRIRSRGTFA